MERLGTGEGNHKKPGSEKSLLENPEDELQVSERGTRDPALSLHALKAGSLKKKQLKVAI
jgi:hypothetical protein